MGSIHILVMALAFVDFNTVDSCTSILISCNASAHGYAMLAHAADCSDCDSRIALVPSRLHNETDLHAVRGIHHQFPREWSDRATVYYPPGNGSFEKPLGYIPEVNETYAAWESVYSLMNEHGLTIGESSTYSRINSPGVDLENPNTHSKGPALFSIAMLIQVALERCKTALCAVETMGAISEEYGFYAETFNAGESLSVVDTFGDGWIFHILPDPTGRSSVWCARRVPQGHVAALANQFTISTINSTDLDNYRHSENMYEIAISAGLWDGQTEFKFNHVFGTPGALPMYISVRLWFIYNSVAPSLNLQPRANPFDFPFSVPVDKEVSLEDIMAIYRSRYEGTEFDMTQGILAGPFHNPQRVDGGDGVKQVGGQITRPIAIQRTAYTMIGVADPKNPLVYYATDTPTTSVFVPFLAKTLKRASKAVIANGGDFNVTRSFYSDRYQTGSKYEFDRYSAWWAFDFVANWMNMNYQNMSTTYVYPAVSEWQSRLIAVASTDSEAKIIAETDRLIDFWWKMADMLIVRYNDGYFNYPESSPNKVFYTGYPADFLRGIGFNDGFVYPVGVSPWLMSDEANTKSTVIFDANELQETIRQLHYLKDVIIPTDFNKTIIVNVTQPEETVQAGIAAPSEAGSIIGQIMWSALTLAVGAAGGIYWAQKRRPLSNPDLYTHISA